MLCQIFRLFAKLVMDLVGLVDIVKQLSCLVEVEARVVILVVESIYSYCLSDLMQVFCLYV